MGDARTTGTAATMMVANRRIQNSEEFLKS